MQQGGVANNSQIVKYLFDEKRKVLYNYSRKTERRKTIWN